jgi:hypothetical protein
MLVLAATPALAQFVVPPMPRKAAELGYAYKWFDRDVESGPIDEADWQTATFYARFAPSDWLTISAEGATWDVTHEDFPGQEYRRWTVGGGANVRAYTRGRWSLDATVAYNEILDHDESPFEFDKRTTGWNVGAMVDCRLGLAGHSFDLYGGPMYVDDEIENFPYGADEPIESDPDAHWGAVLGASAVFFQHASAFTYVLFLDHPQARVGFALRLGGGEE